MPLGTALGLPVGAVVDLDRTAEAPVDLYVNGMRFARGQLLVTDEGEWAVSIDELESEGLRVLDMAPRGPVRAREGGEPEPQALDTGSDHQIADPASEAPADPQSPQTPEVTQTEVEGAVT